MDLLRLDWAAAANTRRPLVGHADQFTRRVRRLENGRIRTRLDVFFLAREKVIVAFGAALRADGAGLASGAFALARLAGSAGDSRAFSRAGVRHDAKVASRRLWK